MVEVVIVPEQRKVPSRDAVLIFPPGACPLAPPQPFPDRATVGTGAVQAKMERCRLLIRPPRR